MELVAMRRRYLTASGVVALLLVLAAQLGLTADRNSITWDEDDHIYAGYLSLTDGDHGLNPEHPPLVKMVAVLPILSMPLELPPMQDRYFKGQAFLGGRDFVFQNDANTIVFRTRMAASLFTLLLVVIVFLAAREMFGAGAAFIAATLLVFDPNLLAHGAVVTTDVALSCFLFAATYAFYRYVKEPSVRRLLLVGVATGLAFAAKHTGVLVVPMLLLLAVTELLRRDQHAEPLARRAGKLLVALVVVGMVALAILWAFYGFRYQARPEGVALNPSLQEMVNRLGHPSEAKLLSTLASWKLLPESYLFGLADVRFMGDFYQTYIFGKVYAHGVWFYFPAAFAIKSTLPFLLMCVIAVVAIATRRLGGRREVLFLTIPPAVHFGVAMLSTMNIGVRHILPVYVYLAALTGGAAWALLRRDRRWAYAITALLIFHAASSLRTFPAYLAYANEAWGGPSNTHKYLTDSNVDWAQQFKTTARYLEQRGLKECWFAYFAQSVVDTSYYGIPCKPLPTTSSLAFEEKIQSPASIDGPVLISAGVLSGFEFGPGPLNPYDQFQRLKPTTVLDYAVFVYDGHFDISQAASLGHTQRARNLLGQKQPEQALADAQRAVELAPDTVGANAVLGDVLTALNRRDEARSAYQRALTLAKTVEPEFQRGWVPGLEEKLKAR